MNGKVENASISRIVMMPGMRLGKSIGEFLQIPPDSPGRRKLTETNKELDRAEVAAVVADLSGKILIRGK